MLTKTLSIAIYRVTNRYTVALLTLLFCLYIFWILPGSANVERIVGSADARILPFFPYLLYTPGDLYAQLGAFGPKGRAAFVDYRIVKDTLWLLTLGGFLALATSAALRYAVAPGVPLSRLNLVAPLPALFDLLENQLQNVLVLLYPARHDSLAMVAASLTATKWVTLVAAVIILLAALARAAAVRIHRG